MKRNGLVYGIALLMGFSACNVQEDELEPSGGLKNWLQIDEKPGEFNQLVYEVYRETGMPIFVNDTLGSEYRGEDAYGNPIIHYEMYVPRYSITGEGLGAAVVLSSDTAAMIEAVRVIREQVISRFPENPAYRPRCILLADTLYTTEYDWTTTQGRGMSVRDAYADKDMMGIKAGGLADILKKTADEKAFWAGMILARNIGPQIESLYAEELEDFYAVTDTLKANLYNRVSYKIPGTGAIIAPNFFDIDSKQLGFMEWKLEGDYAMMSGGVEVLWLRIVSPTKEIDVVNFIAAVYAWDETEIQRVCAGFPKCLMKYEIMKKLVQDFETNYANKTK